MSMWTKSQELRYKLDSLARQGPNSFALVPIAQAGLRREMVTSGIFEAMSEHYVAGSDTLADSRVTHEPCE